MVLVLGLDNGYLIINFRVERDGDLCFVVVNIWRICFLWEIVFDEFVILGKVRK